MRVLQNYFSKVLATGLIVSILLSLPFFWSRFLCKNLLGEIIPQNYRSVDIKITSEIEIDPNVLPYCIEPTENSHRITGDYEVRYNPDLKLSYFELPSSSSYSYHYYIESIPDIHPQSLTTTKTSCREALFPPRIENIPNIVPQSINPKKINCLKALYNTHTESIPDILPQFIAPMKRIYFNVYTPKSLHILFQESIMHAEIGDFKTFYTLGIGNTSYSLTRNRYSSDIYYLNDKINNLEWIFFDKKTGQINYYRTQIKEMLDETKKIKKIQLYAGPEGVSEIPDKKLGRFTSLVAYLLRGNRTLILYDKNLRRFFYIDFINLHVTKSPQLLKDDPHRPVDIGILGKNPNKLKLEELSIQDKSNNNESKISNLKGINIKISQKDPNYCDPNYLLVLDESGQIDLLDKETLEFAGPAGHLPEFELNRKPDNLLAYTAMPMTIANHKNGCLFTAAINREGTSLMLSAFNEKGKRVASVEKNSDPFSAPWAPLITVNSFVVENLHPPILSLASFFTANSFEACSGHRALFLLPNSFVAIKAREARSDIFSKLFSVMLFMSPSIVLAILLTWRVDKDAAVVGLPRKTRRWWIFGTIAFGLVGYITYRLIRPKVTLVTCANCGKPRRPDLDKCHRCGSKWDVPELLPPAWRVLDV